MACKILVAGVVFTAMLSAMVFSPSPAAAGDRGQIIEEIIVVAPRITREREDRAGQMRILMVERDERVDITDLDLSRTADMIELEKRVKTAARFICGELSREYPHGQPSTAVCIRRAIDDAMIQVQEAVRAAIEP